MRHMRSKVTYTDRLTHREADKAMAIGEKADLSKKTRATPRRGPCESKKICRGNPLSAQMLNK